MAKKDKKAVRLSEIIDDRFTFKHGDEIIKVPTRMTEPVDRDYVNRNVEEPSQKRKNPNKQRK